MKIRVLIISIFLLLAAIPAWSATSTTATARISITNDNIPAATSKIITSPITMQTSETGDAVATNSFTVTDPTGSGMGWMITAKCTDLISQDGLYRFLPGNIDFRLDGTMPGDLSSKNDITGIKGNNIGLNYSDQTILKAKKGSGKGVYQIEPKYSMKVQKNLPSGNYQTVVLFTIFTGP